MGVEEDMMTLKDLGELVIYIGAVCAALAAIGVVARFVVYKPLVRNIKQEISVPLNKVHSEVNPNHGASMKDQLTSIEKTLNALTRRLDDHLENHS